MYLRTFLRVHGIELNPEKLKNKKNYWLPEAAHRTKEMCFWGIIVSEKIGIL
jgi:hypothetical protein